MNDIKTFDDLCLEVERDLHLLIPPGLGEDDETDYLLLTGVDHITLFASVIRRYFLDKRFKGEAKSCRPKESLGVILLWFACLVVLSKKEFPQENEIESFKENLPPEARIDCIISLSLILNLVSSLIGTRYVPGLSLTGKLADDLILNCLACVYSIGERFNLTKREILECARTQLIS